MANQWLRLWHDMPNDPKWRTIARVSKQSIPSVMCVYLHVLVDASSNATERGRTQSINCEDIATALDLETDQVEAILVAMQGRVLEGDQVAGWDKRQPLREDGAAERAKVWREEQKKKKNAPAQPQTNANATEREQTPDKDTEEDKDKSKNQEQDAPKKQARPASARFDPLEACPPNVSQDIWGSWVQLRKEKRNPLTATMCEHQAKQLAGHVNPDEVVRISVAAGWTGLFPEKVTAPPGNVHQHPAVRRHNDFDENNYEHGLQRREDGTYGF